MRRARSAESVAEVLEWVHAMKEERRFELFVETADRVETRAHGWTDYRKLIRLAGDFTPGGTTFTIAFHAQE